ncbi:outer membrane protein assembly factor BamA [Pseudofulvimonas gallinarii]|jgi:outer membrane protein insertion porin family|uniref:Outer membrane protein assembly factor BamA n=1 Tax=Pseudofulvimonas gallinarii TaxID=634155 RepID=A0A4S3KWD4_9GAMM|nr:outer membrane protein assembly factor BamA [Pseudofulvimonas gallinarii]TCT00118.1 Beta-barrel assembly machine subunit BamA [Pseudofulvimonas gallinarii]THD13587.1 outer membrane protein assembly factor BamA [Pseudofulvimonas gallinarii]
MKKIAAAVLLALATQAQAQSPDQFVIQDIRIDGLSRITEGTVFNYLPLERGDTVDRARVAEAIRILYQTGFFDDVELSRQGDILVVQVKERPAIASLKLSGNKEIKEDDLLRGLADIGLAEGEVYNRLAVARVTQELTRQYNNRGKYNVSITPVVNELDRNRVEISIVIAEGKAARIRHINVIGNETFSQKEITRSFDQEPTNWTSWYSRDDQYSREKFTGDLEKLVSYYQDRGYLDFDIDSNQVTISPDRRNIYITTSIREGEIYTVKDVRLTGELVLEKETLEGMVRIKPGEVYSRAKIERTSDTITAVLGNIGYAFAEVTPIPDVNRDTREVGLTFLVSPGKRVYVRRVVFKGNTRTQDEVLRREMRQFEGAWFSQAAVDRSRIRLQRLGYFENVEIETPRVPGSEDLIDVEVSVEERPTGAFQFGVGYSQLQGIITNLSVEQNNFLGTGNRAAVNLQNNRYYKQMDLSYTNPYVTDDGLSIGYNASYRELDFGEQNLAAYSTDTAEFNVYFGLPLTETDTVSMSLGIDSTRIDAIPGLTPDFMFDYLLRVAAANDNLDQRTFHAWRLEAGWSRDSRNRFFNPTRGGFQQVGAEIVLPGSTQEYYKLYYRFGRYFPVNSWLTLLASGDIGYGDGYGNAVPIRDCTPLIDDPGTVGREEPCSEGSRLPFFENFYAGGVRSIRGFEDNSLGPRDPQYGRPIGGAFRTIGTVEAILPTPFRQAADSTRISWFVDFGNVYPSVRDWEAREFRISTGLSFQWRAPVGPIVLNFSYPIQKDRNDEVERFQFTFGSMF